MKESTMDPNSKLSLSWDAYEKSICSGLGLLQQVIFAMDYRGQGNANYHYQAGDMPFSSLSSIKKSFEIVTVFICNLGELWVQLSSEASSWI